MCRFCDKFDFSRAKVQVKGDTATIVFAGGSSTFPPEERFTFCPHCGAYLVHDITKGISPNIGNS